MDRQTTNRQIDRQTELKAKPYHSFLRHIFHRSLHLALHLSPYHFSSLFTRRNFSPSPFFQSPRIQTLIPASLFLLNSPLYLSPLPGMMPRISCFISHFPSPPSPSLSELLRLRYLSHYLFSFLSFHYLYYLANVSFFLRVLLSDNHFTPPSLLIKKKKKI